MVILLVRNGVNYRVNIVWFCISSFIVSEIIEDWVYITDGKDNFMRNLEMRHRRKTLLGREERSQYRHKIPALHNIHHGQQCW
jgi:hypothetical protein